MASRRDLSVEALLLSAQEAERTRIARELHDDIGQRLAVLTIDLDLLENALASGSPDALARVRALSQRSLDLAKDIQGLSHRLFPTMLDYLGIAPAFASSCADASTRHRVDVSFGHENVPDDIPRRVALVLFRVLQEAVENAVRHSGANRVDVTLRGEGDCLRLEIVDGGRGFDPDAALNHGAPGLVGMRERARLLGGELVVRSRPGAGTSICARVPVALPEATGTSPG